ncbi:TPA: hypothetical protein ACJHNV_004312, partial [Shigella dysenteriae]
ILPSQVVRLAKIVGDVVVSYSRLMSSGINPLHCEYVKHQKKMNQIYKKSKYTYQDRKHDITLIPLWRIF